MKAVTARLKEQAHAKSKRWATSLSWANLRRERSATIMSRRG